jgi:DNA-directed RNA polymerase subunit RPC12/RpoP
VTERGRPQPVQCPDCNSFRTEPDRLMNAITSAMVAAPDAPRDLGRPLPFYICKNCWHTFTVSRAIASRNNET